MSPRPGPADTTCQEYGDTPASEEEEESGESEEYEEEESEEEDYEPPSPPARTLSRTPSRPAAAPKKGGANPTRARWGL